MAHARLIKTVVYDGVEIPFGIICGTKDCLEIHRPNGCHNCPMQKAAFEKLKYLEDIIESEKNESHEI